MDAREKVNALEQVAQAELQAVQAPGAAVAVVYEDEVLLAKVFGIANSETKAPVSADMLFRIGSVTKVITAYTLLSLMHEQRLNVHTPIGEYVPDLPQLLKSLTVHQLLSHTAGLKDDDSDYGPHDEGALGKAVRHYDQRHFCAEPGTIFSYSGLGYAIAGVVIEAIGKKSYAQVVTERILNPLQMRRSTFSLTQAMTYPFSQGHRATASGSWNLVRPYDDNATRWPAGFLFSNVIELARFSMAFMNGGQFEGEQVLGPEVISTLAQAHAQPPDAPEGRSYGYGLYLGEYAGMRTLEHSGGRRGFCSFLQMFPEQRFAIIQLVNQANVLLKKTQEKALELVLSPPSHSSTPLPDSFPTPSEGNTLIGCYASPDINATENDDIRIVRKDNRLMLHFGDESKALPVLKRSETRFAIRPSPELQPIELVLQQGLNKQEEYLCWANRAYKRRT
ncbi:class A beta-lactamase-related serine hydrolase [Ktedonosporobacter rubrisoli]|uniref:Class A beta-lactamase-related serine hydrolase n=1 Tax=Ktedonosporobacter rubrisoli TaxID=2509675 RepID=A0A4P6JLZ6_KTERU|nr:serine hydrolase domain-containing protein [Ktedonosporobacter rubrisoli]QBD76022.1 class A beta-lactamase-related serine hydrolase [Ktedonosporobacter rubrisoli]